jgi:hypothetical protein
MVALRCVLWLALALSIPISGCSARSGDELGMPANVVSRTSKASPDSLSQVHDFGKIFSEDQSLRHEFTIRNPSDRAVRLIGAVAVTPCCSMIGPLPDSIPSKGQANVPTVFKPGFQSGARGVAFLIETDSPDQRQIQLALRAELVSAWETESLEGSTASVPLGQPGTLTFRVKARRKGSTGRVLPDKVSAMPPVQAGFAGQAASRTGSDGSVEATRDVWCRLPATNQPGQKRGELTFVWLGGRTETVPLGWQVRPRLRLTPSGLVLRRSNQPIWQTIAIESDGPPFQVVSVASPLLAGPVELPNGRATRHSVRIELNLSETALDCATNVIITTDQPDQSSINLSLLVVPGIEAKGE